VVGVADGTDALSDRRGRDRLAQCMLHMEEVQRVRCTQVRFNLCQKPWRLIAGRLNPPRQVSPDRARSISACHVS